MPTKPWPKGGPIDLRQIGHRLIYRAANKTASTGRGRDPVRRRAESSVRQCKLSSDEVRTPVLSDFFRVSAGRTPTHELFLYFQDTGLRNGGSRCVAVRAGKQVGRGQAAGGRKRFSALPTAYYPLPTADCRSRSAAYCVEPAHSGSSRHRSLHFPQPARRDPVSIFDAEKNGNFLLSACNFSMRLLP